MAYERQYSDAILGSMQLAYGQGYLSPGGAEEVIAILEGLSLAGRNVLDLGCGVGGAAVLMAGELGAGSVLGVDVEEHSLELAADTVQAAGLTERVNLRLIEPGPLPLPGNSFDVVFTNDAICHVPDKRSLIADVFRVLRPGGVFAGGDWMKGEDGPGHAIYNDWVEQLHSSGLRFRFESVDIYTQSLEASGFEAIEARNSSAWSEQCARDQLDYVLGSARQSSIRSLGKEAFDRRVRLTRTRLEALASGSLQHWYVRARKPD